MSRCALLLRALPALLFVGSASPAGATVTWNWSFASEAGTFRTDGDFADTGAPGVFAYREGSFDVHTSQGGLIQPTDPTQLPYFAVGSAPTTFTPGDLSWNGTAVTAFSAPTSSTPSVWQANANSFSPLRPYIYELAVGTGTFFEWTGSTFVVRSSGALTVTPEPQGSYSFLLDRLEIVHSGGTSFVDEFDDGAPPPSGGYNVMGTPGPEAGGLLTLDELGSVPGPEPGSSTLVGSQLVGASTALPVSVSALYELELPDPVQIEGQGAFLAYIDPVDSHVHTVVAAFQSAPGTPLALSLIDTDTDTSTPTVIGLLDVSSLFAVDVEHVEVRLDYAGGLANATLNVFDGGVAVGGATLPQSALVPGAVVPSAGFQVFMPEPGIAGLWLGWALVVGLARFHPGR